MFEFIRSDIANVATKEPSFNRKFFSLSFNPGFHAVLLYRISRWFLLHKMLPVAVLVSYVSHVITGSQISPHASIGKGLGIYHPQGVIIGATATIGENCRITSGVLIGQRYGGGDRPTIGNNFYAGAGSKVLGKITLGDKVSVGANSVVLNSFPSKVTLVGIPARSVTQRRRALFRYQIRTA